MILFHIYETTEDTTIQKVWLYHPEFAIENTIEYIKFYIVQEVADPDISNQYSFYTLDSNNDLVVHNMIHQQYQLIK